MLKYGNKEYRNLQEQVLANMRNIEDIIKDKPTMVNNISLHDSTYTPSDGTITLPGLVTTGTEQTVSAKKNFTDAIEVKGTEIDAEARIGTYPRAIDTTGILNVEETVGSWVKDKKVDFKNHTISSTAYLYFEYPELLEHYGLHGDDGDNSIPWSAYILDENVGIPETITTEAQLKAYVKSSAFASAVDSADYTADEYFMANDVATYASNIQDIFFNGTNIIVGDILNCQEGEGKQIVGASAPITEHVLKTKNLKVENLEAENVNGKPVCRALYVHKLSLSYASTSHAANFFVTYISSKPEGYSSLADLFKARQNTSLSLFEKAEYTRMDGAFIKFSSTGSVLAAAGISMFGTGVSLNVLDKSAFSFVSDEVVGRWNA